MFVCCCRHECTVKHFQISRITQQSGTVYILDRQFQTLQDLVKFYCEHDVPNVEAVAGVRLSYPVLCTAHDMLRRRVSASDAAAQHNARDLRRASDVLSVHNLRLQILRNLKKSKKNKSDASNRTTVVVASQSSSDPAAVVSDNLKRFDRQPAIPNDIAAVDSSELSASSVADGDGAAGGADVSPYYSEPRDVERNLSADFIARLLQQDNGEHGADGKCVCGLYLADSELPQGWSMHISTECGTEGRLFFTSPTGETSWELPTRVSVDLDAEQQDRIRRLMIESQHALLGSQLSNSASRISV